MRRLSWRTRNKLSGIRRSPSAPAQQDALRVKKKLTANIAAPRAESEKPRPIGREIRGLK